MNLSVNMCIGKVLLLASPFLSSTQGDLLPPEPEDYIDCPLCANATHEVYSNGIFVADSGVISCQQAFEKELRLEPLPTAFKRPQSSALASSMLISSSEDELVVLCDSWKI
jgi:hypothetical protein